MNIAKDFPALNRTIDNKKLIYFDNACTILKPRPVIDAIDYYYTNLGGCAGSRGSYSLSDETNELCDRAREKAASFIKARSANEIIWTRNTTESINLVANAFNFSKGDEVITTVLDHHSNLLPFYEQERKGRIKLKVIDVGEDGRFDLNHLENAITRKTKLLSLLHASNVTGAVFPLKEICSIAHEKGILVLSDEAQFVPHHKLDVRDINVDFCAFSAHKLGGPSGMGVLYGREDCLNKLGNFIVGGGTIHDVKYRSGNITPEYLGVPQRFEGGLQDYAGIIGFGAIFDYLETLGMDNIESYEKILTRKAINLLNELNINLLGREENRSPLLSFRLNKKDISAKDISIYMDKEVEGYKIMLRTGNHCAHPLAYKLGLNPSVGEGTARISFFAYNTLKEIDIFAKELKNFMDKTESV